MYRKEECKGKTTIEDYLENYVDVETFLECCKECGNYGKIWSCPPYDFHPEDYWRQYRYIYLLGTKIIFDKDTIEKLTDEEEMQQYMKEVLRKEKELLSEKLMLLEEKYPGSISLSAGSCHSCEQCAKQLKEPCRNPGFMRYSIESIGGNVGKTTSKLLGIELQWMGDSLPEYFTLVNGFLSNDANIEF